jgi:hypothetical protein
MQQRPRQCKPLAKQALAGPLVVTRRVPFPDTCGNARHSFPRGWLVIVRASASAGPAFYGVNLDRAISRQRNSVGRVAGGRSVSVSATTWPPSPGHHGPKISPSGRPALGTPEPGIPEVSRPSSDSKTGGGRFLGGADDHAGPLSLLMSKEMTAIRFRPPDEIACCFRHAQEAITADRIFLPIRLPFQIYSIEPGEGR